MTPTWDCADARVSLGVYVLGAIDPAERALVDAHLLTCRDCRDELAGLAGLPALLARVNPDEISRICADDTVRTAARTATDDRPPAELIGTVLDLAEARRRRSRWRFVAAAAAAVVIAGGLFGGLKSIGTQTVDVPASIGTTHWEAVHAGASGTVATASIAYSPELWGTAFQVLANRIPLGTTCQLWVVHPDGTRTQVAAWTTARDEGTVWYGGSMPSTAGPISSFQITANDKVLMTATPT